MIKRSVKIGVGETGFWLRIYDGEEHIGIKEFDTYTMAAHAGRMWIQRGDLP